MREKSLEERYFICILLFFSCVFLSSLSEVVATILLYSIFSCKGFDGQGIVAKALWLLLMWGSPEVWKREELCMLVSQYIYSHHEE